MTMTDPISDMLARIKNASMVGHKTISMPYSKIKHEIAKKLFEEKLIGGIEKENTKTYPVLVLTLLYEKDNAPTIKNLVRLSKPGRRRYVGAGELQFIRSKQSLLILSTPKGILTDTEARRANVGGELLLEVS